MTHTQALDAQWETERLQRSGKRPQSNDLDAPHILSGVSATGGQAEDRELTRAARYVVRKGRDDTDRGDLLEAFGLTWEQASPVPGVQEIAPPGWKTCRECRTDKPIAAFARNKLHSRHSQCRDCDQAEEAS